MDRAPLQRIESELSISLDVFAWKGGEIVLIGERTGDRWNLSRGWRAADCLTDIRRWAFVRPELFVRQIKRLVLESGVEPALADSAAEAASHWVQLQP